MPREESISKGRSHCDSCQHILQWYDLFPIFSFLLLRGKCRYCHANIGWQTMSIELLTGILFSMAGYFLWIANTSLIFYLISLLYVLCIFSCFIIIFFIDLYYGIIPNSIVYPATMVAIIYHLVFITTFLSYLSSGLIAGLFFFLLFAITKGKGMGFGDVKLALLLGLFLGFPGIVIALYIAFLTGALVASILVIMKKKKFSKGTISFGPFLIFGTLVIFFYGSPIGSYVLKIFFNR